MAIILDMISLQMDFLLVKLPKAVFFPVYIGGIIGFIFLFIIATKRLIRSKGIHTNSIIIITVLLILVSLCFLPVRSTRYFSLLSFPITYFCAFFMISITSLFKEASRYLVLFTVLFVVINTAKVFHIDRDARFAYEAAEKISHYTSDVEKDKILFVGNSKDIGRIAFQTGCDYYVFPYSIYDREDFDLLKEHFCDKYSILFLVQSWNSASYSFFTQPLFFIRKGGPDRVISFFKVDLEPSPVVLGINDITQEQKNLFLNHTLERPMTPTGYQRIKDYFQNNPEGLKIVNKDDFFWPYAWPFDHASDYFPNDNFDLCIDSPFQGKKAIHISSLSKITFYYPVPFSAESNYTLSLGIQFLKDSEVSISQYLYDSNKLISQDEIKTILGKKGEERTFHIAITPGKFQRLTQSERKNKTVYFYFSLLFGDARFFDFSLQIR